MTNYKNRIRLVLRHIREQNKLTQKALSAKLGKVQSFVAKYELGESEVSTEMFIKICLACEMEPANVLDVVINGEGSNDTVS